MSQKLIDQKLAEKEQLISKMERQKDLFLEELVLFTKQWFESETKGTIKSKAEEVVNLGEERAKELKTKIGKLIEDSASLVQEYLSDESIWWHYNEDNKSYYSYDHRLIESLDITIKRMFGELGVILKEYDLATVRSYYSTSHTGSWSEDTQGKVKYSYGVIYSDEILKLGSQYVELIREGQEINSEIEHLKDELKKENVEQWWDSL